MHIRPPSFFCLPQCQSFRQEFGPPVSRASSPNEQRNECVLFARTLVNTFYAANIKSSLVLCVRAVLSVALLWRLRHDDELALALALANKPEAMRATLSLLLLLLFPLLFVHCLSCFCFWGCRAIFIHPSSQAGRQAVSAREECARAAASQSRRTSY